MTLPSAVKRSARFFRKNGLLATVKKAVGTWYLNAFDNRTAVYCLELKASGGEPVPTGDGALCCSPVRSAEEVDLGWLWEGEDRYWSEDEIRAQMRERYRQGAVMWILSKNGVAIGSLWETLGKTITPFYFPLTAKDACIFDWEVNSRYRGEGYGTLLMRHAVERLRREGFSRIFMSIKHWNIPSIRAAEKSGFRLLGAARKRHFWGIDVVRWYRTDNETGGNGPEAALGRHGDR